MRINFVRKLVFAMVLGLALQASSALAQINIQVDIGTPPPPPVQEAVPQVPAGFFWIPGYWYWDGHRHLWADGHLERSRPGYRWVAPRWDNHGQYHHYEPGRWEAEHRQRERERRFERRHDEPPYPPERRY